MPKNLFGEIIIYPNVCKVVYACNTRSAVNYLRAGIDCVSLVRSFCPFVCIAQLILFSRPRGKLAGLTDTSAVSRILWMANYSVECCDELFQRRRRRQQQLTTSSITKLRYTTAKTFDEDARRAWQQQPSGSRRQAATEIDEEVDGGVVWQSQQRHKGHDDCRCARCRSRLKPAGNDCSTTSALYVTEPSLY